MQYLPAVTVATPFLFGLLIILVSRGREIYVKILVTAGASLAFVAAALLPVGLRMGEVLPGRPILAAPLTFSLHNDYLGAFFSLVFAFCFLLATIYSLGYLEHSHSKARFCSLLLLTEGAMLGVVLAGSLAGLFVFFEIMAITIYLLVIHEEDQTAMFAGAKFLFMTVGGGLAIFFGLVITYHLAGRVDFVPGGYLAATRLSAFALVGYLVGFGVKAGMAPLHIWLPDAHPASPAPVSALLSGCSIKTGVYGLIRIIHEVYGVETIRQLSFDRVLLVLAVITILLGSAMALQQDQLKRRLAYSSVAQIGYILLGISLLNDRALFGALFHVFSHAMMKSTLFLCAGGIIVQTGRKYVSQLAGVGYLMPSTLLSFSLAAVAIVGMPPFIAFISKLNLALGALEAGLPLLILVLVASSVLNALYYFPIVIAAFFAGEKPPGRKLIMDRLPAGMLWTTVLMASCCGIFAFIRPNWPVIMINYIITALF